MRILFYNWVDYLDDEKRGGGVTVYQRNVLTSLVAMDDVETCFLSSGISYDILSTRPRWSRVRLDMRKESAPRYELINAGTLSPSHHSFGHDTQVSHPQTEAAFFDFIEKKGPFDVIHFNNLEGIPVDVLKLKARWPDTKVILSLHNYYPFCPQVNLWYRETRNCTDYQDGRKCDRCLPFQHNERTIRVANGVAFKLKKIGIRPGGAFFDYFFRPGMRIAGRGARVIHKLFRSEPDEEKRSLVAEGQKAPDISALVKHVSPPKHAEFAARRQHFVETINQTCDAVLCVSDRVREIAIHHGITPDLAHTCYIGTRHAELFAETAPKASMLGDDGQLTLAYMGYMRRDKGFFFLLQAMERLPAEIASRVRLVVCAKSGDPRTMNRLSALGEKLSGVYHVDGYTHDQLDEILAPVDVGLVPVLWEDNLPQVAIEMHARHIPLLTSDLGGAKELANCPEMVFTAGSSDSFRERLEAILAGEVTQDSYWANAAAPVSMDAHIDALLGYYRKAS